MLDHAEEELSEEIIKELHRILKQNTKDSSHPLFNARDYKKIPNLIGGEETTKPSDVPLKMRELVSSYKAIEKFR